MRIRSVCFWFIALLPDTDIVVELINGDPATWTLIELIKAKRVQHMWEKYQIQALPLVYEDLQEMFNDQVMCP